MSDTMKTVLLSYLCSKKKVYARTVENEVLFLKNKAIELFGLKDIQFPNLILQKYDDELDGFLDVDEKECIEHKDKLKVLIVDTYGTPVRICI